MFFVKFKGISSSNENLKQPEQKHEHHKWKFSENSTRQVSFCTKKTQYTVFVRSIYKLRCVAPNS